MWCSSAATMSPKCLPSSATLRWCSRPTPLYDRPSNVFVAGFTRSPPMNLLPATITATDLATIDSYDLPIDPTAVARATGPVILGIRPRHSA